MYNDKLLRTNLFQMNFPEDDRSHRHAISSIWAFDKLRPATKKLLQVLTFLDPDCVPESLLEEAAHSIEGLPSSLSQARKELLQVSLARRNSEINSLRVHRLIQDTIMSQMSTIDMVEVFWSVVDFLQSKWPTGFAVPTMKGVQSKPPSFHRVDRWSLCQSLYPHVHKLEDIYANVGPQEFGEPRFTLALLLADAAQ